MSFWGFLCISYQAEPQKLAVKAAKTGGQSVE
jgi:hypothetical protein